MRHLILLFGLLMSLPVFPQSENDLWYKTDTVSTDLYEFQVPSAWRNYGEMMAGAQGPEQFFEASGQGLPVSFNGGPVKVSIFLVKLDKKKNLEKAKESTVDGYFDNPDRMFRTKRDYEEEKYTLSDQTDAVILNTRFYRKSKGLNQSRYDLITYSQEHKTAYMLTVSIQYIDESYTFETDNDLREYAKKLYSTFKWK